jgi:hypothetical protein
MLVCCSPELESPGSHAADFLGGDSILELSNLGPGPPGLPSLMRGVSDVTTDSDVPVGTGGLPPSASDQDIPTARWRATSAGLWPVSAALSHPLQRIPSQYHDQCAAIFCALSLHVDFALPCTEVQGAQLDPIRGFVHTGCK